MNGNVCVLACGARKRPGGPHRAIDLYSGPYFTMGRAWALQNFPPERVFILSALHGLVTHDKLLMPYDQRMGDPGSVGWGMVAQQAGELHLLACAVVMLGGSQYRAICERAWHPRPVYSPFAKAGGIGHQMAAMKKALANRQATRRDP